MQTTILTFNRHPLTTRKNNYSKQNKIIGKSLTHVKNSRYLLLNTAVLCSLDSNEQNVLKFTRWIK